jgi:hypothetical protein
MTFGEWLETEPMTGNTNAEYISAWLGWMAGQNAERARIKQIIEEVGRQGNHDKWFDCADAIAGGIEE